MTLKEENEEVELYLTTSVKHRQGPHRFTFQDKTRIPKNPFLVRSRLILMLLVASLLASISIFVHVSTGLAGNKGGYLEVTADSLNRNNFNDDFKNADGSVSSNQCTVDLGPEIGPKGQCVDSSKGDKLHDTKDSNSNTLFLNELNNYHANSSEQIWNETVLTHINFLKKVTTNVRGYDIFRDEKPARFIPVLEARGINDNDKDEAGHRRDTLPIANAIADHVGTSRTSSAIFQFLEEHISVDDQNGAITSNLMLKRFLGSNAHGVVVRNNPGTLSPHSQKKFDNMLRDLSNAGLMIMTHPDVMATLGAKDALVKIKHLNCGLEDTEVYYDPESFIDGFRKSIAFQPRVIKQNRGSQGEGIWIVKLKNEDYCRNYGECIVSLNTEIVLMEAWDNHIEYHTVGQFLEFCIHGRSEFSGIWTSTGRGRYFEGGMETGSMMVDQRFLPRIVEGEVRCLFVGSELVEIVHKKPKEGGLSATLASGAVYTKYAPDDDKFANLVEHLKKDVPRIMESFHMADHPLPLLWTADYIYDDSDDDLRVGEINCSCPGITQQLEIVPTIAKVAIDTVFSKKDEIFHRWQSTF